MCLTFIISKKMLPRTALTIDSFETATKFVLGNSMDLHTRGTNRALYRIFQAVWDLQTGN